MTAMDKASENAEEILKELKINYNKARQEAIPLKFQRLLVVLLHLKVPNTKSSENYRRLAIFCKPFFYLAIDD